LLTVQLIRLLKAAATGATASEGVAALLGFAALQFLPLVLSLTLFISILLTLSRSYRDSEMVIWFSSGLPLTAWVRPVLRFAVPVVLLIAVLSLFLSPWAVGKRVEFMQRMDHRDDLTRVTPGAFNESARGDRVFFVESVPETDGRPDKVRNVFISSIQHGRQGVVAAAEGHVEIAPNGDRFIVLSQGRRYEGAAGVAEYRLMAFDRYAIRIEAAEDGGHTEKSVKSKSTWELVQQPSTPNRAELIWRIGVPISALVLALWAIPLSFVNPRAGRTPNLILALLTYMIYSNLLSVGQAWVGQGRIPFVVGAWAVHGLMLLLLIVMFWKRLTVYSPWRLLRR
ncbi:MAG: LPS export ABC transporter permease LptF, partial [Rhodocyclaceae bacterium]